MNKLDEIIKKYEPCINSDEFAKAVALEFAKYILEEAAENAKAIISSDGEWTSYNSDAKVIKSSVTDTLNKYL